MFTRIIIKKSLLIFLLLGQIILMNGVNADPESDYWKNTSSLTPEQLLANFTGSFALVIGNSDYENWDELTSVLSELEPLKTELKAQGFTVIAKNNLNGEQLRRTIDDFIRKYGYTDTNRLIVFYSGHGESWIEKDIGYLVPVDAPLVSKEITGKNKGRPGIEFRQKALSMSQIKEWAGKNMSAKHALFVFDSCFSGTIFTTKSAPPTAKKFSKDNLKKIRYFITAGNAKQLLPAKSIFTPAFVDALKYRKADLYKDGVITGTELGIYLNQQIAQYYKQTPSYGAINDYELSRGEFFFYKKDQKVCSDINQSIHQYFKNNTLDKIQPAIDQLDKFACRNNKMELRKKLSRLQSFNDDYQSCKQSLEQDRISDNTPHAFYCFTNLIRMYPKNDKVRQEMQQVKTLYAQRIKKAIEQQNKEKAQNALYYLSQIPSQNLTEIKHYQSQIEQIVKIHTASVKPSAYDKNLRKKRQAYLKEARRWAKDGQKEQMNAYLALAEQYDAPKEQRQVIVKTYQQTILAKQSLCKEPKQTINNIISKGDSRQAHMLLSVQYPQCFSVEEKRQFYDQTVEQEQVNDAPRQSSKIEEISFVALTPETTESPKPQVFKTPENEMPKKKALNTKTFVFSSKSIALELVKEKEMNGHRTNLYVNKIERKRYSLVIKGYRQWSSAFKQAQALDKSGYASVEVVKGEFEQQYSVIVFRTLNKAKAQETFNSLRNKGLNNLKLYSDNIKIFQYVVDVKTDSKTIAKNKNTHPELDIRKNKSSDKGRTKIQEHQLSQCNKLYKKQYYTSREDGQSGATAYSCYKGLLSEYGNNETAHNRLSAIETKYQRWFSRALQEKQWSKAQSYLETLTQYFPEPEKRLKEEEQLRAGIKDAESLREAREAREAHQRGTKASEQRQTIQEGITKMELIRVKAGHFIMGSPDGRTGTKKEARRYSDETPHKVTLSHDYYLGKYEVTQGEWETIMGSNPSYFKNCGADCPVEQVSWDEIQTFINRLNKKSKARGEGGGYRLPTEAEWEYAARAGSSEAFSFGATISPSQVNYNGNYPYNGGSKGEYRNKTVAVGSLPANAWGFHEMHGNVWEWVSDVYAKYSSTPVTNPGVQSSGPGRVNRGGSWGSFASGCRSASRDGYETDLSDFYQGFRLARSF